MHGFSKRDVGALIAVLGTLVGTALPWVRKLPAGRTNGDPYYTSELVWGLRPGIEILDLLMVVPLLTAVLALVAMQGRERVVDGTLLTTSLLVLWFAGQRYAKYHAESRYAVEPGLYLVLAGGTLLALLGTGDLVLNYVADDQTIGV